LTLVTRKRTEAELRRDRRYRERHRDEIRVYAARWTRDNREKVAAKQRRWRAANPLNAAFVQYRASARERNLEFALDRALFEDLVTDRCFYCGQLPSPLNGIDRVYNESGYVFGNVVAACGTCNLAKRHVSPADFAAWVARLTDQFPTWEKAFA
jgi:hypothetical protein